MIVVETVAPVGTAGRVGNLASMDNFASGEADFVCSMVVVTVVVAEAAAAGTCGGLAACDDFGGSGNKAFLTDENNGRDCDDGFVPCGVV